LIQTEALIIGAGPVGLFQAFQLGLQDIRCHLVDALPQVGGQCSELYADKPIYDIPGIPLCTGQELIDQLQTQIKPFAPQFHLQELVSELKATEDDQWYLQTDKGTQFKAATVFIAAGVGAFVKRGLNLPSFQELLGKDIFYKAPNESSFKDKHLLVLGDNDAALEACALWRQGANAAASVTLVHRRDQFQAAPQAIEQMRAACNAKSMRFVAGQPTDLIQDTVANSGSSKVTLLGLEILNAQGETEVLPADAILLCLGISPKLGPLSEWGLAMERKQLVVNTENFATQVQGIFAVGDINTYPGKKKLILCGFHEATLAAFGAAELLHPERKTLLQYTTTSTHLHKLLGVS
jgi:thioredoxin reductase (NADPH)